MYWGSKFLLIQQRWLLGTEFFSPYFKNKKKTLDVTDLKRGKQVKEKDESSIPVQKKMTLGRKKILHMNNIIWHYILTSDIQMVPRF